ncbi:hypothetical protein V7O62_03900 [Methanolobus sp. ZRKC2]|uniref:hypothetical protein n=1 Tax=Methanolobus sp. ZRKC2 TaxID=3125783 RepID=UPI0032438D41
MNIKTVLAMVFLASICFASTALADVSFINHANIQRDSINLTITEKYTGLDSESFRNDLDLDESGFVDTSELDVFKEVFLDSRADQFLEYFEINGNKSSFRLTSVDMSFDGADGEVNEDALLVTTFVNYELGFDISTGKHDVWILGHPLIEGMTIILPQGMDLDSYAGLENVSQSTKSGRLVLEGSSSVRSFMINETPTFEYAVLIEISREPFYKKPFFLPLLFLVEILLALLALYIIKKNKIK